MPLPPAQRFDARFPGLLVISSHPPEQEALAVCPPPPPRLGADRNASICRESCCRPRFMPESKLLASILVFAGTYLVLALGRIPGLRLDRTGAAIVGASLMLAFGVLTVEEAYAAIDYDTLILLFGLMLVVANLRLSCFFALFSAWAVAH